MTDKTELADLITLLKSIYDLKKLLRQGWIRSGVPPCSIESIAAHSFGAAVIGYFLACLENEHDPHINPYRVATITLFHDFLESMYLDLDHSIKEILPSDEAKKIKKMLEDGAHHHLKGLLSSNSLRIALDNVISRRNEKEKTIMRIADKLELGFQARNYYLRGLLSEEEKKKYLESLESIRNLTVSMRVKDLLEDLVLMFLQ